MFLLCHNVSVRNNFRDVVGLEILVLMLRELGGKRVRVDGCSKSRKGEERRKEGRREEGDRWTKSLILGVESWSEPSLA